MPTNLIQRDPVPMPATRITDVDVDYTDDLEAAAADVWPRPPQWWNEFVVHATETDPPITREIVEEFIATFGAEMDLAAAAMAEDGARASQTIGVPLDDIDMYLRVLERLMMDEPEIALPAKDDTAAWGEIFAAINPNALLFPENTPTNTTAIRTIYQAIENENRALLPTYTLEHGVHGKIPASKCASREEEECGCEALKALVAKVRRLTEAVRRGM